MSQMFDMSGMDLSLVLGLMGGFAAVCLLVSYLNFLVVDPYRKRRMMRQRLRTNKKEAEFRAQIFKAYQETKHSPVLALFNRLTGLGKVENLQRHLLQADLYINPAVFISMVGIIGCMGVLISMRMGLGLWAYLIGPLAGYLPIMVLRFKKKRKTLLIEKHMPDAMDLLARSLRAGHTLPNTLELVAQEIPAPLGKEMRITYEEQRLGLSVSQALRRMSERVASQDLRYFVTAVMIQSETGGNLAEILENIGTLIRERLKLKGKVQALTAEGRFSAYILIGLPIAVFGALFFLNRPYIMTLLTDPTGNKILGAAILSVTVGAVVMKKLVTINV
jgi:tight adherence protein B